jgi:hypothetical protein
MNQDWAAEHLQVIRTLMERSALYRRALAPMTILAGGVGILVAAAGYFSRPLTPRSFLLHWLGAGLLSIVGAFLLARRQAIKDAEPVWTLPTRRVIGAALPAFIAGGLLGGLLLVRAELMIPLAGLVVSFWLILYGCALHAAGFFMRRGVRLFGWLFVALGSALLGCVFLREFGVSLEAANLLMGVSFGGGHLAYGGYLLGTEKGAPAA